MKKRFLICILTLSVMFMGAGYAAWTQEFNIENAVNTGKLEFTAILENPRVFNKPDAADVGSYGAIEFGDSNGQKIKADKDNNELLVNFKDAYSDYRYEYDIQIENQSTMAICYKLEEIGISEKLEEVAETTYKYGAEDEAINLEALNEKLNQSVTEDIAVTVITKFKKDASVGEETYSRFYGHKLKVTGYQFNSDIVATTPVEDPNITNPQIGPADWKANAEYKAGDIVVFTWKFNPFDLNLSKKYYYKAEFRCKKSNENEKPMEIVRWFFAEKAKLNTEYWQLIDGTEAELGTNK